MGCSNGNDDDASPKNPFVEKTFYGSTTIDGKEYDVCELQFTSETEVTLTLYGQGEKGSDKVETLKYTVSDGKATVTYNEKKITTSAIKDDTFTASLDGTDENTCSFSTTQGTKYQSPDPDPTPDPDPDPTPDPDPDPTPDPDPDPTPDPDPDPTPDPNPDPTPDPNPDPTPDPNPDPTPDPDPNPENPFAGKTFYGSYTFEFGKYDIYELRFTSETKVTMIAYGLSEDGSDVFMTGSYTVASGKATIEFDEKDYDTITTSVITNDTFIIGEEPDITSFSKTPGTKITEAPEPEDPDTPTTEVKTAAQFQGSIGTFDLEWKNGVAVVEKDLIALYKDGWNNNSDSTISFALLTVKDDWDEPCYKESEFNFGEEVDLKIASSMNNIVVTSAEPLANKKIRLTFTGTEETIKCKVEIIGVSDTPVLTAVQFSGCIGDFDLEWTDGVAVIEKELNDSYVDTWNDKDISTISFALLTAKGNWDEPCYKATIFDFGEEVNLKIATNGNNIVTSKASLAGKKIKLTFTETKETIKCKAEIVE